MFGWHSIGGVLIASFIYLGFLAAGEEIEQPFGWYIPFLSPHILTQLYIRRL